MALAMILLKQITMMFIFMLFGVLLFRNKKITTQGSKELGSMLLYMVIPVVIIKSFCIEKTPQRVAGLGWSFLLSFIALSCAILLSYMIYKRKYPLDNFAASFSNAGFIGIPLVQAAIGEEAVFYIASFIALLNILQWTYGLFVMQNQRDAIRLKSLLHNPIILSTSVGLLCFFLEVPMPSMASAMMTSLAALNTPIAMLISGVYLAQIQFSSMFRNQRLLGSSLLRLCAIPLVTIVLFILFPMVDTSIRLAILIAASAPVGSNIAIFSSIYENDYLYSVKTICFSTILSIVTMPCMIMLAQQVF